METNSEVLTEGEVAERLRVSTETVRKWRREGVGPPAVEIPGRLIRYQWRRVVEWLERDAPPAPAEGPGGDEEPTPAPRRAARRGSSAPEQLSTEQWNRLASWAADKEPWAGPRLEELTEACLGHFRASGRPMVDWCLVVQNWVRNERTRFGRVNGGSVNGHRRKIGPLEAAARNIAARMSGGGGAAAYGDQAVLDLSPSAGRRDVPGGVPR